MRSSNRPRSIQQAPHTFAYEPHSNINHPNSLDTLPPSFSITGVVLKRCAFPRLSLYRVKEVIKPCLFVYLLTIHSLKGSKGKMKGHSVQLKSSHQNYTNLDLIVLA